MGFTLDTLRFPQESIPGTYYCTSTLDTKDKTDLVTYVVSKAPSEKK